VSGSDTSYSSHRLSTASLPAADRLPTWREVFGQTMVRLDIEPGKGQPFHAEGTLCALPGAAFASVTTTPVCVSRTRRLIAGDGVDMLFLITANAPLHIAQGGREQRLDAGDALFLRGSECSVIQSERKTRFTNIAVPVDSLTPLLPGCEDLSMTVVSRTSETLRLLLGYVDLVQTWQGAATNGFGRIAADHVRDLLAATAATMPALPAAAERAGIRAARLGAVKADIELQLCEPGLSIHWIAASNRISPRYIRRLFQDEGTTFSDFVLGRRLEQAYRLLLGRAQPATTIGAIAYACGFCDLSYFNRTFRRRFGMTPTDLRNGL
jgi:AraC-like DNA-binding protein